MDFLIVINYELISLGNFIIEKYMKIMKNFMGKCKMYPIM